MKRLVPILTMVLGGLLIACNAVILLTYYFSQWFPSLCFNLSMIFGINLSELVMFAPSGMTGTVNLVLTSIGIVCGLGIILTNRVFRILVIILAGLKILCLIGIRYILFKMVSEQGWDTAQIISAIISLAVPIGYIIFLTRRSVKEYFIQEKLTLKKGFVRLSVVILIVVLSLGITIFVNTRDVVYTSEDLGISITLPRDWEIIRQDEEPQSQDQGEGYQENNLLAVALKNPSDMEASPMVTLSAGRYFNADGSQKEFGTTFEPEDAAQTYVDILKQMMNFTVIEEPKKILLDGVWAVSFVADFDQMRVMYTAVINNDTAYILQNSARSPEDFKNSRSAFDKVLYSVKFK